MTLELKQTDTSLTIRRTFDAHLARVWQYFTNPAELTKWYAPGHMEVKVHVWDAREGGLVDIEMGGEDKTHEIRGVFLVVHEMKKLVHTWERQHDKATSKVTVELRDNGHGRTDVILTHGGLANGEEVEAHAEGWASCFDKLAKAL